MVDIYFNYVCTTKYNTKKRSVKKTARIESTSSTKLCYVKNDNENNMVYYLKLYLVSLLYLYNKKSIQLKQKNNPARYIGTSVVPSMRFKDLFMNFILNLRYYTSIIRYPACSCFFINLSTRCNLSRNNSKAI